MTPQETIDFFIDSGWSRQQSAGIVANLVQESSLNSNAVNSKSGAFGLAQWLGDRLTNLKNFASKIGKPASDYETQLKFINFELLSSEKKAGSALFKAQSSEESATVFSDLYERASNDEKNNDERVKIAQALEWGSEDRAFLEGKEVSALDLKINPVWAGFIVLTLLVFTLPFLKLSA